MNQLYKDWKVSWQGGPVSLKGFGNSNTGRVVVLAHWFASREKSWGEEGEVVGAAPDERFLFYYPKAIGRAECSFYNELSRQGGWNNGSSILDERNVEI